MTRAIRHMPGNSNRVIEKFGDVVTLDHVDMLSELAQEGPGLGGFKYMVSILDCHRNFRWAEPVVTEDHLDVLMAAQCVHSIDNVRTDVQEFIFTRVLQVKHSCIGIVFRGIKATIPIFDRGFFLIFFYFLGRNNEKTSFRIFPENFK